MRIREQLRGSMPRDNAAAQYAVDGTIKINVLRECFRHKNAQMAKVNPHKFQSNYLIYWRRGSESNRRTRLCRPLHDHSATPPGGIAQRKKTARRHKLRGRALALPRNSGAGKESRTPDLNLGKVALYQLSYSRVGQLQIIAQGIAVSKRKASRVVRHPTRITYLRVAAAFDWAKAPLDEAHPPRA